ncbi:MAG: hypothetical protein WAV31_06260 [Candidatus Moraniibacteriota bacterium]
MKNENKIKVIVTEVGKYIPPKYNSTKIIATNIAKAIQFQFDKPLLVEEDDRYSFDISEVMDRTFWDRILFLKNSHRIITIYIPEVNKPYIKCSLRREYISLKSVIIKELKAIAEEAKFNKIIIKID